MMSWAFHEMIEDIRRGVSDKSKDLRRIKGSLRVSCIVSKQIIERVIAEVSVQDRIVVQGRVSAQPRRGEVSVLGGVRVSHRRVQG